MAEPFKNLLNKKVIETMALNFQKQWPDFDHYNFLSAATDRLETLELKQRTDRITNTMAQFFPADYEKAAELMLNSLGPPLADDISVNSTHTDGITGWAIMPLANYVGMYGHGHFDLSMTLFKAMTKRASAEFGIRFFIQASPYKTLAQLKIWTRDECLHVRRLVSEATRPR
ncbi:MAG TPA: DNA alkylation repair protein, partial [Oceanospirillales bacterium]|nr:DNA alkylation repair protein [Oceanospirillales bacterium]